MDESAKRRERLQALRLEAAAEAEPGGSLPAPAQLFNPLAHPPPSPGESPTPPPRFDYYTDPVSAFSGSKRRCTSGQGGKGGGFSPLSRADVGPRNYSINNTQVPVMPQFYVNQSPDQSSHPMSFPVSQSNHWRSPVQFRSPYSGHRGTQFSGPAVWNASGGSSWHVHTPNSSRGGFRSPSYDHQGSPRTNFGRGGSQMNSPGIGSPHSNSRRGTWTYSGSPSSGWSGGRGRGFDGSRVGSQESAHFYSPSMLEDPWRDLKPIVGNILVPRDDSDFWLPESLQTTKKANVTGSSNKFKTQASLAEYLAFSLEEATDDKTIS